MTLLEAFGLFIAGIAGGALNSVAGGGGFVCFPALVFVGIPPVSANATALLALWPGSAASTLAYKGAMRGHSQIIWPLVVTATIGGVVGAMLLLHTGQTTFMQLVPWLMLLATLLFAFSRQLQKIVGTNALHMSGQSRGRIAVAAAIQLVIATYLSFFGGGAGIIMLALFAMMGIASIHTMNGIKLLLASICTGVGIVAFILAKAIFWPHALLMLTGATAGGYFGAIYAQRVPPNCIRWLVIVVGAAMTVYFFVRT